MEQENKTWWTLEEHRSYFGLKNLLAARRWCHRRGVRIAHGMVNKNEIFNCLSGTANVPRSSLYKCITKNETQKQGDEGSSIEFTDRILTVRTEKHPLGLLRFVVEE